MKTHLKNIKKYIKFQENTLIEHKEEIQKNPLLHTDFRRIGLEIMIDKNKKRYEKELHIYNEMERIK